MLILALMMCFSSNYIYQQIKILGGVHLDVLLISIPFCEYGFGICSAPDTICPRWQGTFCELDLNLTQLAAHYTPKAKSMFIICDENETKRDCHKCIYEVGCHGNPVGCKRYKRDAPDGGYYG